jgi:hypothetical protein
MLLCFPLLGLAVFSAAPAIEQPGTELLLKAKGIEARGVETPQGFLVRAGSHAVVGEVASIHAYISEARSGLIENGVLQTDGQHYVFTQDYPFASPSTAAGVVLGRSASGRIEWKSGDGTTLKAIQEAEAEGA